MSQPQKTYFVTGANSGVGLVAARQLRDTPGAKVYMLCRSEKRAKNAMENIGGGDDDNLRFLKWDALDGDNVEIPGDIDHIDGLLLNAGGFGDGTKGEEEGQPSQQARLNLLGHVALVKKLQKEGTIGPGTRLVAAGSEGCFAPPSPSFHWPNCDFAQHLTQQNPGPGGSYTWIKGILAFYWAAFARKHPDLYVATVSPGAIQGTQLFRHGGSSGTLRFLSSMFILGMGSNTVEAGASRYLDALLERGDDPPPSGSFYAHRKGYNKDFGDVTKHKQGGDFGNQEIQDKVWDAVEALV